MSWCHMVMEGPGTIHPSVSFYSERSPPHHVLSFSLFIYLQSDLLGPWHRSVLECLFKSVCEVFMCKVFNLLPSMERRGSRREGGRKGGVERDGVRVINLVYKLWVSRLWPQEDVATVRENCCQLPTRGCSGLAILPWRVAPSIRRDAISPP